jgi:hypothetical protein
VTVSEEAGQYGPHNDYKNRVARRTAMSMEDLYTQFPDVHPNIVLKTDMLRQGVDVSHAAMESFQQRNDLLWKGFHLFSYDFGKTRVYGDKIPLIMHLEDGCPVQVRTSQHSPYLIDFVEGDYIVRRDKEVVASGIWFEHKPRWYDMRTEAGVQMSAIAQGSSRMIFVTMNKFCELWNKNHQCLFCNINTTLKDQKAGGEDVVARIEPDVLAEVIKIASTVDHHYCMLYITGGTILTRYRGQTELEFYVNRLNAIRDKLNVWIPACVQVAAYDDEGWKRLHETGIGSIQPNIEVWDKKLFQWICPGKDHNVGYDEWIKRTIRAVDFWGPGRVNPNFVLGIEMAKPHGFEKVSDAVRSTSSGWDFLMSHGVLPRFNLWTQEPGSAFADQPAPPLEYFMEAQKAYTELRWKHKLEPPFPAAKDRYSYVLNCLQDFEYYHGNSTLSKSYLDARLGVKPGEKGGRQDAEGYTLLWR